MPSSSQMKKEEAELRKIAKQSRQSQKEAKARERKQAQQQRRKAALAAAAASTADGAGTDAKHATAAASGRELKSFKRKGAVILPEEVADLRRRLFVEGAGDSPTARSVTPIVQKQKKGGKRKAKESPCKTTEAALPSSSRPVPPYSLELHHKNKQVLVDVTLHHVPAAHIDVSETTDTKFVVDASKHTKKYRLELPMPEGIRIDAETATCELDCTCGVLKCVLPIKGDIPHSFVEEREKMLEAIRKQKTLRFRMDADGELKVRSRQALLAKSEREQTALADQRKNGTSKRPRDENETETETETAKPNAKTKDKMEKKGTKGNNNNNKTAAAVVDDHEEGNNDAEKEKQTKPLKKKAKNETSAATATVAATSAVSKPPASNKKSIKQQDQQPTPKQSERPSSSNRKERGAVFAEEHKRAMELAKAAGKASQMSLRESIARAKAMQQKRIERSQVRAERREVRSAKTKDSFARVLEEQQRQLLARAELLSSVAAAEKKAEERRSSGKTVSFALAEDAAKRN